MRTATKTLPATVVDWWRGHRTIESFTLDGEEHSFIWRDDEQALEGLRKASKRWRDFPAVPGAEGAENWDHERRRLARMGPEAYLMWSLAEDLRERLRV